MSDIIIAIIIIPIFIYIGWVIPIRKGLRVAREKNRSPEWMWFGVHPIAGWIAYAVLNSLPALKICSQCQEKVKNHAKVCPYCLNKFEA